ncbi:GDYXXLXY domain-containing protein [Aureisphaera galaxeae]|uniref:GDYXXLXY domain-containing protein n=1 Tax=Aureisphaera galaxeae TaxID=1538023 RepID=UPI0023503AC3|nr:GDYXXLXY domain-containing protein [Aureisphaera galaxeae]MDC8005708.1 GDYXXLXY domain-containing protein [Aureisphaera galaxeae]
MNKLVVIFGFLVMVGAQWFVPANMIYQQEGALVEGTPYKFKTRPVDPSDPFRGKYIVLNYELSSFAPVDSTLQFNEYVYVYIEEGEDGFAKATEVSPYPLDTEQDFVKAEYQYSYNQRVNFNLPFDRFYMEESKARPAEDAVRDVNRNRDSLSPVCYALVYVKEDVAVLENVFIGETSIQEFVEGLEE